MDLRERTLPIPKPRELEEAMSALAESDLYFGRIKKTQSWHLLSYALDLMTAGVAIARQTSRAAGSRRGFHRKSVQCPEHDDQRYPKEGRRVYRRQKPCVRPTSPATLTFPPSIHLRHNLDEYERIASSLDAKEELDDLLSNE